jgi:hypothetical protein
MFLQVATFKHQNNVFHNNNNHIVHIIKQNLQMNKLCALKVLLKERGYIYIYIHWETRNDEHEDKMVNEGDEAINFLTCLCKC